MLRLRPNRIIRIGLCVSYNAFTVNNESISQGRFQLQEFLQKIFAYASTAVHRLMGIASAEVADGKTHMIRRILFMTSSFSFRELQLA
jgi:hypothetical protein